MLQKDEQHATLHPLWEKLRQYGERPAIIAYRKDDEEAEQWSYDDLDRSAARLAAGLRERGVRPGDQIVLLAPTSAEWIVACLAVLHTGCVVTPLDVQYSDEDLRHVLHDCDARLLFTTAREQKRLDKLGVDDRLETFYFDAPDDYHHWRQLLHDEPLGELADADPDRAAILFYTSGTTGKPKGVPLTHRNIAFELDAVDAAEIVNDDDRLLLPLPLHHVYPLVVGTLAPLSLGLPIIVPQSLTGPQIMRAIKDGGATIIVGVPRLYRALLAGIESRARSSGKLASGKLASLFFRTGLATCLWLRRKTGLSAGRWLLRGLHKQFGPQLRVLASGGSPLDPGLGYRLESLGWRVAVGYGLTETSPLITIMPPGAGKLETVGKPIDEVEVKIDRSGGRGQESGDRRRKVGEVLVRGPNVFGGYRNLEEKTAESFTDEGFFRTGDLGYFDSGGWLRIVGRASTMIVTEGGENVQPDEVEDAYAQHAVIREIGVLERDRKLVALIAPERSEVNRHDGGDGREHLQEAVRKAVEERSRGLPSYQRLADFALTSDPLPRTRLGKLRRHKLEDRYRQAKEGKEDAAAGPMPIGEMSSDDRSLLDEETARQVWQWLAQRFSDQRLTPDASPHLDLGVDSMEWLNLSMEIRQRTGVELTDEAIGRIETVRDLLEEVTRASAETSPGEQLQPLESPEDVLDRKQLKRLEPYNAFMRFWARLIYGLNWLLARLYFRLEIEGMENIPNSGHCVFTPNHTSHIDPFVMAAAFSYRRMQESHWAGWTGATDVTPLHRFITRLAHVVPIDPRRAVASSLAFGALVLKREKNLVWFPEGQRSGDGRLQRFKPGLGLLLDRYPAPIVPVIIDGAHEAMPNHSRFPRPRKVRVTFHPPLDPRQLAEQGDGDEPHEKMMNALHGKIIELLPERYRPRR